MAGRVPQDLDQLIAIIKKATAGIGITGDVSSAISAHTIIPDAHHNWPLLDTDIPASIARDTEVTSAISAHTIIPDAHHDPVTSGDGIGVAGQAVSVNSTVLRTNAHAIPATTDTYDLGSATKLWRKGWLSELESVLFVENSVQVTGGWWMIPHGSGTLAEDVDVSETQIDFGTALSVNDFILLRGNLQVEYMQVTAFVSGTTYTVSRNKDGSGANSWPQGQVFVVLGYTGDGRIEFDAQTAAPRMSIITQGTSYNAQTEIVRLGDLTGMPGVAGSPTGIFIGDASQYMKYHDGTLTIAGNGSGLTSISGGNITTGSIAADKISVSTLSAISANMGTVTAGTITGATIRTSSSGARVQMDTTALRGYNSSNAVQFEALTSDGKLTAGGGNVTLDADGVRIATASTDTFNTEKSLKFGSSAYTFGYVYTYVGANNSKVLVAANSATGESTSLSLVAVSGGADLYGRFSDDLQTLGTLYVGSQTFAGGDGDISYTGDLIARRSSVNHTVQAMHYLTTPVKLKDNVTVTTSGYVTLTGIPAAATAVLVYISQNSTTVARVVAAGYSSIYVPVVTRKAHPTIPEDELGTTPVASNQIYLYVDGTADNVFLYIYGYAI